VDLCKNKGFVFVIQKKQSTWAGSLENTQLELLLFWEVCFGRLLCFFLFVVLGIEP
jgi:hypothetical protein